MVTRCPKCDGKVRVDDEIVAAIVCPLCNEGFRPGKLASAKDRAASSKSATPSSVERAYCPFCGKKFKTSKPGGSQVRCPGCKCKFKLSVSNDTAPADPGQDLGQDVGGAPRHDLLRKEFMDDLDRQVAEQRHWRNWNESARRQEALDDLKESPRGFLGWLAYMWCRIFIG